MNTANQRIILCQNLFYQIYLDYLNSIMFVYLAGKVKCSICHEETPVKALLDNRLVSQDKAENAECSGSQPEEKQSCMACEEDTPAASYCLDCAEWLCEQCVQVNQINQVSGSENFKSHLEYFKSKLRSISYQNSFQKLENL